MIEAQGLANWQQHANWSQPWIVEQDYIISRAVALIFKDGFPKCVGAPVRERPYPRSSFPWW